MAEVPVVGSAGTRLFPSSTGHALATLDNK